MANKRASIIYVTKCSTDHDATWYSGLIGKKVYIWENEQKPGVYFVFDDGLVTLFIPKYDAQVIV